MINQATQPQINTSAPIIRQQSMANMQPNMLPKSVLHLQKMRNDNQPQLQKLMRAYSQTGSSTNLKKEELTDLFNDLMSTLDYPKLSTNQLKVLFDSIDTNKDQSVSFDELEEIIRNNPIK